LSTQTRLLRSEVPHESNAILKVLSEAEVIQQEFLDPDLRYSGYDPEEGPFPNSFDITIIHISSNIDINGIVSLTGS